MGCPHGFRPDYVGDLGYWCLCCVMTSCISYTSYNNIQRVFIECTRKRLNVILINDFINRHNLIVKQSVHPGKPFGLQQQQNFDREKPAKRK